MQVDQIAFLLNRGKSLIRHYLDLLGECEGDRNMEYHLEELFRVGCVHGKKNLGRRLRTNGKQT